MCRRNPELKRVLVGGALLPKEMMGEEKVVVCWLVRWVWARGIC